ncbi:MAG: ABC transporter ATP-binding protein [Dehalococcoidia bacterium]|nr:ABC transporter ATP-binding protein [Dehalococcoidia bacterium]
MLEVAGLAVAYGELVALRDVSLHVKEGEIVTVIGSNGAGKTTLLKTISGLLRPRAGRIEFLGEGIDGLPSHEICKRGIIQVPEGRKIFPQMPVLHNLQMGAYLPAARRNFAQSLGRAYALFPRLNERRSQRAGLLSGGEQQMLAMARALMARPKLLMVDEPSLGLAPKLVAEIFNTLLVLNQEGTTILLVSQEVRQALELAQRAYVLENGRITVEGSSKDLLNDPRIKAAYLGL